MSLPRTPVSFFIVTVIAVSLVLIPGSARFEAAPAPKKAPAEQAAASVAPQTAPSAPKTATATQSGQFVLGYYTESDPDMGQDGSFDTMMKHADQIDAVVPFWFQLSPKADGSIRRFGVSKDTIQTVVDRAHDENIEVYALIHNLLYGGNGNAREITTKVLNNPSRRSRLVSQTVGLATKYGFDGVNIDFEAIGAGASDGYVAYLRELKQEFAKHNLKLTVSIPPKTAAEPSSSWSAGYDYQAIARQADLVAIMTYQYHGPGTDPGPIAPIGWVREVMRYAATVIPPEKLLVGVGTYGFDWCDDGSRQASYLDYHQAVARARRLGSRSGYDQKDGAPWIRYTDGDGLAHEVWYEDARSAAVKLEVAKDTAVRGIALWRLGMEDPAVWDNIR